MNVQYISGRVTVGGRTFRAWVRMQLLPVLAYSIRYEERDITLRQCGDGSFCEIQTGEMAWNS